MEQNKRARWRKLDNAAKLYSATSNRKDTRVFRFYCELKEEIDKTALQQALDRTVEKYPIFLSVMRKGLFWHYLERSSLCPVVREEYREPCSSLYIKDKKNLLFEVTYYGRRINFEVFHALTDGTGATEFMRELVKQYLVLRHQEEGLLDLPLKEADITVQDQENDSFMKHYSVAAGKIKVKKPKAFQIRKTGKDHGKLQVGEATLSVTRVLQKSRELGVSMTVLLAAVYIYAIQQEMTMLQKRKPVILMVPVNLRKFFPSDSMLNFFGWIEPGFQFDREDVSFEEVLEQVKKSFKNDLTKEKMIAHISRLIALERHPILKFAPLEIKNFTINTGAKYSEQDTTAIFSNMGAVVMPEEYAAYIDRFGVFTNTPKVELCMCSFQDTITLGFTSRFDSTNIQRNFYRLLESLGISSQPKEPVYPESDTPNLTGVKVFRTFSFICIVAAVAVIAINTIFHNGSYWSLIAVGGIASLWTSLSMGYYKRHNLLKNAMWQLILITCGCMIWDALTGWRGWSIDYVFPAASVAVMLSVIVISRIQSHTAGEYMIYLLMAAGYGCIIPFILLLAGAVHVIYPSVICSGIGFLVVIGLMIFHWREFKEEMHKNFHV